MSNEWLFNGFSFRVKAREAKEFFVGGHDDNRHGHNARRHNTHPHYEEKSRLGDDDNDDAYAHGAVEDAGGDAGEQK